MSFENIPKINRYSTFWRRFWALWIDGIIMGIVTAVVSFIIFLLTGQSYSALFDNLNPV